MNVDGVVVLSQKGRRKFVENGKSFSFEKTSKDGATEFWKCDVRGTCKARLHIRDGQVVRRVNRHTHPEDASKIEVLQALSVLRNRSVNTLEQTAQVVATSIENLSQAGKGALPSIKNLKRRVQGKRVVAAAGPANPQNLVDLMIPQQFTRYEREPGVFEDFLLHDSGPGAGEDRILIFSTRRNLEILQRSSDWAMDGTFDIAPPLFSQIYSIHAVYLGRSHPLVFGILPSKRRTIYDAFFAGVLRLSNNLQPTTLITDFEMAAIQAAGATFPNAVKSGCLFHLTQNIHRRVQNEGLQERYETDANFALQCRMIGALAFVPPADVTNAFDALAAHVPDELVPVLDYFEDTYIGRPNRRGVRRNPLFSIAFWNMYNRVLQRNDRTTNAVEAWHRGVKSMLGMIHPTIWKFIKGLIRCQKLRDVELEQLLAGHPPPPRKTVYIMRERRIETIVADYANRPIRDYLRGLAYNISH